MYKLTCLLLIFTFSLTYFYAQEEVHPCDEDIDKKVTKLLATYKKKKDIQLLVKATQMDEECAKCWFMLGEKTFKGARYGRGSYKSAISSLERVEEICDDYSTDLFYYLGMAHVKQGSYKAALSYFKQFLDFYSDEDFRYGEDYDEQKVQIQGIYDQLDFEANFYTNKVPFDPKRLPGVSTDGDEYLPMISPDNETIFYTHHFYKKGMGIADMQTEVEEYSYARIPEGGAQNDFRHAKPLSNPFNISETINYGGTSLTIDNQEMFITVCKRVNNYNNCDIYRTEWMGYKWSELENLGPAINGEMSWESQPTIAADGRTLYFSTAREGSKGLDIYYSTRDREGVWSKAKPVPGPINTVGDEKGPFMHSDSKTMYFSSRPPLQGDPNEYKRYGAGGFDIYYSKFDDKTGEWGKPKNIGYPINTKNDEVGLMVSTGGKVAYFSSNRVEGAKGWDVFYFDLYKEARPELISLVTGKLVDENGIADQDATIEIKNTKTQEIVEVEVNRRDGSYAHVVHLDEEDEYTMTIKKEGAAFLSRTITIDDTVGNSVAKKDFEVKEIKIGEPYKIEDLYYSTSSADISRKSILILKEFASFLKVNPTMRISIHGHTDNKGDASSNMKLSKARANKVRDFLIEQGIASSRMEAEGFGETKPLVSNDTEEDRAKNRRTEFVILSK